MHVLHVQWTCGSCCLLRHVVALPAPPVSLQVTSQLEQLYHTVSERGGSRDDRTSLTSGSYQQPTQRTGATKVQGERMAAPAAVPKQTTPAAPIPPLPQEISLTEVGPEPSSSTFAKSAKKKMSKMLKKSSFKA